jgi:isoquinoline 1-oxidoreductase beta subunit
VPGFARSAAAKVLGLDDDQMTLHQTVLGGGFGRRLEVDYVAQAAAIAKALPGTAVQTIWSREDDMRHDFYRPAAVTRWRAALDAEGALTGVVSHSAAQAPFKSLSRRLGLSLTSYGPDKTIAEGTFDQPYEFPAIHASSTEVTLPVPVGSWRSVGYSHQGFFLESFVDELAHEAKQDPLRYRQALLKKHPRARAALDTVAKESDWYTPLGPASDGQPRARGVALVRSFSTVVAMVAEVSVSPTGTIRVPRVITAVDVGVAVNPAGVRQQVESAVVYGLSAALHGAVLIEAGRVVPGNFHEYRPLRMSECPEIVTLIVPSSEVPSGVGEPALPAIAPAVGNALFALTGNRLRSLPLRAATSAAPGAGA